MKRALQTTPPTTPVNLFLSMESGNNNDMVTTAILNAATVGSGGTWSISPSPLNSIRVSTGFDGGALLRQVSVGFNVYAGGGGSRSFAVDHTSDDQFYKYVVTTNSQLVSLGCWLKTDLHTSGGQSRQVDLALIDGPGVQAVLQFSDASGTASDGLRAHGSSSGTGSTFGATIAIVENTKYWVTLQFNTLTGIASVAVFSTAGVQIGSTSTAAIDTGGNATVIAFGCDNHSFVSPDVTYFDNILIDWTNGIFPLGV